MAFVTIFDIATDILSFPSKCGIIKASVAVSCLTLIKIVD